jgi:hypothetical protein
MTLMEAISKSYPFVSSIVNIYNTYYNRIIFGGVGCSLLPMSSLIE